MADGDYAVVFSGGGALGAWEVGCLKAVIAHHRGQPPSIVTGASAGAINAAGFCAGFDAHRLQQLWKGLSPADVYRLRSFRWEFFKAALRASTKGVVQSALRQLGAIDSIYDTSPLKRTLEWILRPVGAQFLASPTALAISATDLTAGTSEFFYKISPGANPAAGVPPGWTPIVSTDLLVQALMGTTALPLLFPPMEGHFDGGVLLNQPISPAIGLGARDLYVFIPASQKLGRTRNFLEIGSTLLTTWLSVSLTAQIERVKLKNFIRGKTGDPKIRLCVVRPLHDLADDPGVGLLSFGSRVDELVAFGERNTKDRLARYDPANEHTWY